MTGDVKRGLALGRGDDIRATHHPLEHLREYSEEERQSDLREQRGHDGVLEDKNLSQETAPVRAQLLRNDARVGGQRVVLIVLFINITTDILLDRGAGSRGDGGKRASY